MHPLDMQLMMSLSVCNAIKSLARGCMYINCYTLLCMYSQYQPGPCGPLGAHVAEVVVEECNIGQDTVWVGRHVLAQIFTLPNATWTLVTLWPCGVSGLGGQSAQRHAPEEGA